MFTFKTKAQSLSEIIISGLSLYLAGLKSLWPWSLLLALMSGIPSLIMGYLLRQHYPESVLIVTGILMLLVLPIIIFLVGFILHQLFLVGTQTTMSFQESSQYVLKKLPRLLIALPIISILSWFGLIFLIAPGVFIGVAFVFVAPLILLDDYSVVESFRNSWFLVWNSWWRTFSIIVIPLVLSILVSPYSYAQIPIFSFGRVALSVIETSLINPLFFSLMLTMYYDSKLRHHIPMRLPRKKKGEVQTSATR